jgi:hypothetical protein
MVQYDTVIQDIIEHQYEMKQTQNETREIIVEIFETLTGTSLPIDHLDFYIDDNILPI